MLEISPMEVAPPAPGKATRIAEDLLWFRFAIPYQPNHVNLFALDTHDGWLLLDCGAKSDATATSWKFILHGPLAGQKVAGIIVSHHHPDHLGYAGALAAVTGAPVYIGSAEYKAARWMADFSDEDYMEKASEAFENFGFDKDLIAQAASAGNKYRSLVWDLPEVTVIGEFHFFQSRKGKWITRLDAGHSPGHISLVDVDRKLYLGGDYLLPQISPRIAVSLADVNDDPLRAYLTYLEGMTHLTDEWLIVPSHDWPYFGGGIRARELIKNHHTRVERALAAAGEEPITTAQAMRVLFDRNLDPTDLFFASCEARAHLNYLVTQGKLSRTTEDGVCQFTSV